MDEIKKELLEIRKITQDSTSKILNFIKKNFTYSQIEQFSEFLHNNYGSDDELVKSFSELKILLNYCDAYGITDYIEFSPSLARGLDYYTGMIFEIKLLNQQGTGIGSIAAGGRYDNLVSSFSPNLKTQIVGFSLGVERIYTLIKDRTQDLKTCPTKVLVCIAKLDLTPEEAYKLMIKISLDFIKASIPCEISTKKRILDSFIRCEDDNIPVAIILGQDEWQKNAILVREVVSKKETEVPIVQAVDF
ncbi:MAG: hypothetical protein MHPSP_001755, partial [Paramarteilia canceri]